jgi:hypothetical protein
VVSISPLTIAVGSDIKITIRSDANSKVLRVADGSIQDLKVGDRIVAIGQSGDDGVFSATTIGINLPASTMGRGGPGGPGGFGGPGGQGGPGGPGGQSMTSSLKGAYTISDGKHVNESGKKYLADARDTSAIYVTGGATLHLEDPTVETHGDSSSTEASSFYGLNAGLLATNGGKLEITGGRVVTSGTGANGLFAYGSGSSISMTGGSIRATGGGGHGVMVSGGGSLKIDHVDIVTTGPRAAPVATDRGGGTVIVKGGKFSSNGEGSPCLYSTGDIQVADANMTASGAEAAVIEGQNTIEVSDSDLVGERQWGVMLYQSFSGDAQGRESHYTMSGGSLTARYGPLFYVTNAKGVAKLTNVKLDAASGVLVKAAAGRWGQRGSNGGTAVIEAEHETMTGDLVCDEISSIEMTLSDGTTLTGKINSAALKLDETSKWVVTGDSVLTGISDEAGISGSEVTNIFGNGFTVRYDPSTPGNSGLGGRSYKLAGGGSLVPSK